MAVFAHSSFPVATSNKTLPDSPSFWESILNAGLGPIVVRDWEGETVFANKEAEAQMGNVKDTAHPLSTAERERQLAEDRVAMARVLPDYQAPMLFTTPEGQPRWVEVSRVPFSSTGAGASCDRVVVIHRDVTAQMKLDNEVEMLRRELLSAHRRESLSVMTTGLAHAVNNMLTPVRLQVQAYLDKNGNEPAVQDALQPALDAVENVAGLVGKILEHSDVSANQARPFHLNRLLDEVIEFVRVVCDRRILVQLDPDPSLTELPIGRQRTWQIALTLCNQSVEVLSRALKRNSSVEKPAVFLSTSRTTVEQPREPWARAGSYQVLTISDNGPGFAPLLAAKLFDPTALSAATNELPNVPEIDGRTEHFTRIQTCARIARSLGGWLCCRKKNGFFYVDLYLPETPADTVRQAFTTTSSINRAVTTAKIRRMRSSSEANLPRRLLLVEDDELVSRSISGLAQSADIETTVFFDGEEAWEHLRDHTDDYGLIVLDLNLPGCSGLDIITRARDEGIELPIIVVSGFLTETTRDEVLAAGADRAIEKPPEPRALLRAFETALQFH